MSDYAGLRIALSALYAQRRGLEITGHNISNVATEGYSRQRVGSTADSGPIVPAFFSTWSGSGMGVSVGDVTRARDLFLEARSHTEHGAAAALGQVHLTLSRIEGLYDEPGDSGLQALMSDFWGAWDEVANRPDDLAAREQLVQRATTMTDALNKIAFDLEGLRVDATQRLNETVLQVNAIATDVAHLNNSIQTARAAGLDHTDLLDQRDALVSRLATLVGVNVRAGENAMVDVYVDGGPLVRGAVAETLVVDASGGSVTVRWEKDGYPAAPASGDVGGLLAVVNELLPRYQAGIDGVANELRDAVNAVHGLVHGVIGTNVQDLSGAGTLSFSIGVDGPPTGTVAVAGADWSGAGGAVALQSALQAAVDAQLGAGVATVGVTGGNGVAMAISLVAATPGSEITVGRVPGDAGLATFFGETAIGLDGVGGRALLRGDGARTLGVSAAVLADPRAVAAARASEGQLGGSAALDLSALGTGPDAPDQTYRTHIVGLGVETQNTQRRVAIQADAVRQIDAARDSESGVNLDEEMIGMVMYQHAYAAASRYMTSIDEMLGVLVERTGLVGR